MAAILADIYKCTIQISLKFVPRGSIDNKPALVHVMAWHQTGNKPLPEPMLTQFPNAYKCGTRGRWVKGEVEVSLQLICSGTCHIWIMNEIQRI